VKILSTATEPEESQSENRASSRFDGAEAGFDASFSLADLVNHPAPELRGLHAWLAVHLDLPEHVDRLIDTDPYGVLTYGDAASLTRSSCAHLVNTLGKLSEAEPWFRSGNRQPLGLCRVPIW
jgi:hypothetical protein